MADDIKKPDDENKTPPANEKSADKTPANEAPKAPTNETPENKTPSTEKTTPGNEQLNINSETPTPDKTAEAKTPPTQDSKAAGDIEKNTPGKNDKAAKNQRPPGVSLQQRLSLNLNLKLKNKHPNPHPHRPNQKKPHAQGRKKR